MSRLFYPRLALTNLRKNCKTYLPYLLTCIFTVMMFYTLSAIGKNTGLSEMPNGILLRTVMNWVVWIAGGFSAIFLFYTNSFLIRQRRREFGLYQVLGMDKKNLGVVMFWETVMTAGIALAAGLLLGIAFGRLMFLLLLKLIHFPVPLHFSVEPEALLQTVFLFLAVFAFNLLFDLIQVGKTDPAKLLSAANAGEREPKAKWITALIGAVLLGYGYYIAQTTDSPLTAIAKFFVAVILVIIGTYALFIAGSIVFLKALKKNKVFYYKTKHFTAVSGMLYRMKQNAAGLSNICIMSTAAIVVLSMCVSLYAGIEDVLVARYPMEFSMSGEENDKETIDALIEQAVEGHKVTVENRTQYTVFSIPGILKDAELTLWDIMESDLDEIEKYYKIVSVVPLEDYNALTGEENTLGEKEVFIYSPDEEYAFDTIDIAGEEYRVKQTVDAPELDMDRSMAIMDQVYIILPDQKAVEKLKKEYDMSAEQSGISNPNLNRIQYTAGFDLKGEEAEKSEVAAYLKEKAEASETISVSYREDSREESYMTYGGFLFLGMFVGLLFIIATVLLIYYKQVSEGYEDRARYQIMQKVGMDKKEVRRSIRSQVLLVFFLPLIAAFIHVAAAFRVMIMLLEVMYLANVKLFLGCTVGVGVVFALFYIAVFLITSREYYKIVQ